MLKGEGLRHFVAHYLLPRIEEVENFEIKPAIAGNTLRVDVQALRRSDVVKRQASVRQPTNKESA